MQEIKVYDSGKNRIQALWQWDREVMLYVNEPSITQAYDFHFFTDKSEMAYVVHSTYSNGTLSVKIPNVLLRESRPIIGSIFTMDGDEGRIEYYFVIVIRRRPQPTDYIQIGSADTEDYVSITALRLDCSQFAIDADASSDASAASALEAKSYAIGGTGTRDGEDADNAKYYMEQARLAETAASESEANAKESETNANVAATASADSADESAAHANTALSHKNAAKASADNAEASNQAAAGQVVAAKEQVSLATARANAAAGSATNAAKSEDDALAHKNAAALSEKNAKASELAAKQSEETVLGTIDEAAESATLSESWAIGGTGTRTGEDTNNSKYFSQQASQHNNNALKHETAAKSYAMGGTGTPTGEDTDNAKYYYTQLQTMMGNLSFATVEEAKAYIGY